MKNKVVDIILNIWFMPLDRFNPYDKNIHSFFKNADLEILDTSEFRATARCRITNTKVSFWTGSVNSFLANSGNISPFYDRDDNRYLDNIYYWEDKSPGKYQTGNLIRLVKKYEKEQKRKAKFKEEIIKQLKEEKLKKTPFKNEIEFKYPFYKIGDKFGRIYENQEECEEEYALYLLKNK